jgi:hypothetical protein
MMRGFFYLIILTMLFGLGCAGTLQETITCYPPQADIYWGKTISELARTGYKTPYTRSANGSSWEAWCYQVRKDAYHDTEPICRGKERYRYLDFSLIPIKTTITSEPSNAIIYWGPSKDQIQDTLHRTPRTLTAKDHSGGASWKDGYYQVKKEGYQDSEVVFLPQQSKDRSVHFQLIQLK